MKLKPSCGFAAALLAAAFSLDSVACSSAADQNDAAAPGPTATQANDFEVQTTMRQLWADEASFTRMYMVSTIAQLPDQNPAFDRLVQTQTQLSDLITSFYGVSRGANLNLLLRERTLALTDVINARRHNLWTQVADASKHVYANGDRIAVLLTGTDTSFPVNLTDLVRQQNDNLLAEINWRYERDWANDAVAYEHVLASSWMLADALNSSLAKQAATPPTDLVLKDRELQIAMRSIWEKRSMWTREFVVVAVGNLPTAMAGNEVMYGARDVGDSLKPYFGSELGSKVTLLMAMNQTLLYDYVNAALVPDPNKMASIQAKMFQNVDSIVSLLGGVNRAWAGQMNVMWRDDLQHTLNQVNARIVKDWNLDLASYGELAAAANVMADTMSVALIDARKQQVN